MKFILKIAWRLFTIFLGLLVFAIVLIAVIQPRTRGWWLHHELMAALDQASNVQVVEHSYRFDGQGYDPDKKEIIYATVTLAPKQIESLRQALPFALDYSGVSEKKCIFEEHHFIAITRKDGSVLTLHICFHCGQIELGSHFGDMPVGWDASLSDFISSLGMHPHGPWPPAPPK